MAGLLTSFDQLIDCEDEKQAQKKCVEKKTEIHCGCGILMRSLAH